MKSILAISIFLFAETALAGSFSLSPADLPADTATEAAIRFDTQGELVNAVEGVLEIPAGVSIGSVNEAGSAVIFWLQPPRIEGARISFAGIIPGGFEGEGILFKLNLTAAEGSGTFAFSEFRAFRNDGQGTEAPFAQRTIPYRAAEGVAGSAPEEDRIPPEPFAPLVSRDPALFEGRYFAVWSAADKGAGIARYEILEVPTGMWGRLTGTWKEAVSPYVLEDQSRRSDVYVRAVDRRGNFTVAKVPAAEGSGGLVHNAILAALLLLLVVIWRSRRRPLK